jgi:hypothetical protein
LILETQQPTYSHCLQVIKKQMMNHASTHEEAPIEDINRFFNIHHNDPQAQEDLFKNVNVLIKNKIHHKECDGAEGKRSSFTNQVNLIHPRVPLS